MHEHRAGRSLTRILCCLCALVWLLPCSVHGSEPNSAPEAGAIDAGGFQLRYRIEGAGLPAIVIGRSVY